MAKTKQQQSLTIPFVQDIGDVLERVRSEVEAAVETVGKRAVSLLPKSGRDQVDNVIERLDEVRYDVNKGVDTLRTDIEKRFKVVRGTIDKRVKTLRKETDTRRKTIEKATQKRAQGFFKWLNLPVRSDLDSIKRRLTALERRLDEVQKVRKTRAAA